MELPLARRLFIQESVSGVDVRNHRHYLGPMIQCKYCNAKVWMQERTSGAPKRDPRFSICCSQGKVELPPIKPTPMLLDL
ncbi:hypothetical protein BGZ99_001828, partial [Dissophora globulifera]